MPTPTNTTTKPAPSITEHHVRAVVKEKSNLKEVPLDATFFDLGLTNAHLQQIQARLSKLFNRTVSHIYFTDTVYTITDRINGKH